MRWIIGPHAGGVGDNLLYSRIPKLLKDADPDCEVLIGVGGTNPQWRNSESYELIWKCNPYVDGFTDEPPNAGVPTHVRDIIGEVKRQDNQIAAVELLHGFSPTHTRPKLYYRPRPREDVRNLVLCSPTSISAPFPDAEIDLFVGEVGRWHGFDSSEVVVLRSKHDGRHGAGALAGNRRLDVASIFEWVDLIASAGFFLCTESGASAIASAVGRPKLTTHALCTNQTMNDKLWLWEGVIYRVTSKVPGLPGGGDYHPYPKTNRPERTWGEVALRT